MIRIITARTLAALREDAAQLPRLRCQLTESRREAEAAAAEAARLAAELDAAIAAASGRLARLLDAVRVPATGPSVQADIALHVVRDMIAEVKASGDAAAIEGIRVMDALLGGCVCPLPYSPDGEVPCVASGRCMRPSEGSGLPAPPSVKHPACGSAMESLPQAGPRLPSKDQEALTDEH